MAARMLRCLVCASATWLVPSTALAQTATALERLEPAPSGDGYFSIPRADVPGTLRASASLALSYAHAPLTLHIEGAGGGRREAGDVVSHQLVGHVLAGLEIARRLKLDIDVPVTLSQGGDSPSIAYVAAALPQGSPTSYTSPVGAAMNDLRLGLRVVLLRQRGLLPAASLSYAVWLPTGNEASYTGTGAVRHAPSIVSGAEYGRIGWSFQLGRRIQDRSDGGGLVAGELIAGAGLVARFGRLAAHGEIFGSTEMIPGGPFLGRSTTSIELLVGARYTLGPLGFGLAGGPGLTRGVGTPAFRLLATVGATFDVVKPSSASRAAGGDEGRALGTGKTAEKIEPRASASAPPLPDTDGDNVPDGEDVCPDVIGDASPSAPRRGCPADRDQDKIADADDRCPDESGVPSADPARFGCPLDTDGDGIADAVDACPKERGEASVDAKTSGCPATVRLEGTQIVILQEVTFGTGSDVIAQESYALLEQVAAVLAQHPEIARIAIDGHTDNIGAERANVTLSQRRAVAVVRWFIDKGVDARRLEARGFGPRRPVEKNDTEAGRAKNRRVEFQILRRTELGAAGWKEGASK